MEAEHRLRHHPLVFVDDLGLPHVDGDDYRHLDRVLRVKPGSLITLGDGAGHWRPARFGRRPEPIGPVETFAQPGPAITVAFTPVKGERSDWVVQKLTELGVDEIVPVVTSRSVVRWDGERAAKQHQRMARVARDACLQSRRLTVPRVSRLVELADLLRANPVAVLADPGGTRLGPGDRVIVIGPEGGFSDDELALAPAAALPGNILRAETAAVVAATIACGFRASYFTSGSRRTRAVVDPALSDVYGEGKSG
jgi:16S rRNA (uracil1498-N3)-methyltransferase